MDCEPRSSAGMAFSPATVNFNEYAWPVSSSRRQNLHSGPRFDLAHEAGLQKLGRDLLRRGAFQGLRRDEAAILAFRRLEQNRTLCVSIVWQGDSSGSSSRFWRRCRRHHREPRTGDEPGGAEEFADHFIGGSLLQAPERP